MAGVELHELEKVYPNGRHAVRRLSLAIGEGELLVLVGPSGCGKTTLLRMIAGLEGITSGEIRIGGRLVNGLSPQLRNIAMVFQDDALYPHKSVRKNLEFPLRMKSQPRDQRRRSVEEVAQKLGLFAVLDHKPWQLSGGQRQRVAMGKAMVRQPEVFLLDEPLSNLDARLRVQIRSEIALLQRQLGTTMLYVTHDQIEAMTLGQRVAVMLDGTLQQVAPGQELYDRPANVFVARFIGSPAMNVFASRIRFQAGDLGVAFGDTVIPLPARWHAAAQPYQNREIYLGLRPEAFLLADQPCPPSFTTTAGSTAADSRQAQSNEAGQHVEAGYRAWPSFRAKTVAVESLGHESILLMESPQPVVREPELAREETSTAPQQGNTPIAEAEDRQARLMAVRLPARSRPAAVGEPLHLAIDPEAVHLFGPDGARIEKP